MFLCSLRGIYSFIEVFSSFHVLQAAELAIKFLSHDKAVDVSQVVGPRLIQLRRYNEVCLFYLFFRHRSTLKLMKLNIDICF